MVICEESDNLKTIAAAVDLASIHGACLTAVYLEKNDYQSMLGDEWISDSKTLVRFFSYMENDRKRAAVQLLDEVREKCKKRGVRAAVWRKKDSGCAVAALYKELGPFDLVVINQNLLRIGADRGMDSILNGLVCPVLIYPQ